MEGFYKPRTYEIKINGHLDQSWAEWFEGMTITYDKQTTILKGEVADNSSLHSLLNRLYDLNLIIISLEHINSNN